MLFIGTFLLYFRQVLSILAQSISERPGGAGGLQLLRFISVVTAFIPVQVNVEAVQDQEEQHQRHCHDYCGENDTKRERAVVNIKLNTLTVLWLSCLQMMA